MMLKISADEIEPLKNARRDLEKGLNVKNQNQYQQKKQLQQEQQEPPLEIDNDGGVWGGTGDDAGVGHEYRIDMTTKLDQSSYKEFALRELAKMKAKGVIPASPVKNRHGAVGGIADAAVVRTAGKIPKDEGMVSESTAPATFSTKERNLNASIATLENLHKDFDVDYELVFVGELSSRRIEEQISLLGQIVDNIKVDSITDENMLPTNHTKNFLSYLVVISNFVESKSIKVMTAALDAIRVLIRSYSFCDLLNKAQSSSSLLSAYSNFSSVESEVHASLTILVGILLMSLPKKDSATKKLICRCIFDLARCESLKGGAFIVPFLGSRKIPLRTRLLVLKLMVKEFGIAGAGGGGGMTGLSLKKTMVMGVACEGFVHGGGVGGGVLTKGSGGRVDDKTFRASVSLLLSAARVLGKSYVTGYITLKRGTFVDPMLPDVLVEKVESMDDKGGKEKDDENEDGDGEEVE